MRLLRLFHSSVFFLRLMLLLVCVASVLFSRWNAGRIKIKGCFTFTFRACIFSKTDPMRFVRLLPLVARN